MTDIAALVERLRDVRWPSGIMEDTALEAADALERLASEVRINSGALEHCREIGRKALAAKDAEIARLKQDLNIAQRIMGIEDD